MYGQASGVRRLDEFAVHVVHRGADPDRVLPGRREVGAYGLARLLVGVELDQRQRGILCVDLLQAGGDEGLDEDPPAAGGGLAEAVSSINRSSSSSMPKLASMPGLPGGASEERVSM